MEWYYTFLIAISALLTLMAIGLPIAFAFGVVGFVGLAVVAGPQIALQSLRLNAWSTPLNWLLLAIPLFILMAEIVVFSDIVSDVYESLSRFFGGLPGSLALSSFVAATGFAAVTGSSVASTATIGLAGLPQMLARGYKGSFAAGCIAAGGGLAIIIPPSLLFILYAYIAQVSVIELFIAGVIPGFMMAIGRILLTIVWVRHNPSIAPPGPSLPRQERVMALARIWPVPLLAIIILGSIYFGIASITESAAMGAFGAVLMALYYRRFSFKAMRDASMATAQTTGFLMLIIVCAVFFGYFLAYLGVTPALSRFVANMGVTPLVALLIVNLLFLALGCVMDTASIVLVVIPIILPGLVGLGLDPIWLGVILAVNLEIGLITPPVGMNLYVMHGIAQKYGITFQDIFRGAAPFIVVDVIVIGLVIAFPDLALWLPSQIR